MVLEADLRRCIGCVNAERQVRLAMVMHVVEAFSHGNRRDLGGHTMREDLLESPSTHKRLAHPSTHSTVLILTRG